MAIKVQLHGALQEFGEEFHFEVHSPIEAINAVEANCPGFRAFTNDLPLSIVFVDNVPEEDISEEHVQVIDEQSLSLPIGGGGTLHIMPVVEGDIETTFFVIASSLTPALGTFLASAVAAIAIAAVITIAAIGIAKLLAPTPPGMDTEDSKPSYYFNGAVNTLQQGNPCPVLYGGPIIIGSQVVSMAVQTSDIKKLRSTAEATFVDVISEGEIEGFAGTDLESSIYLDKVPVKSFGQLNFDEGFDFELKTGTNTQDVASIGDGLYSSTAYQSIGVQVTYASGPVIKTTSVENTDRIEITLYVPSLLKLKDDGDTKKNWFTYRWSVQGAGAPQYVEIETITVEGKTSSGYYFTTGVNLDPAVHGSVPYNVKLERMNEDDDGIKKISAFSWQAMTSIVRVKMRYPNSAYMITKLDARQFNTTPTRGYLMRGLKVKIPNNYNPVTREYSGAWDGNFHGSLQWTDNPAWIFYDLATNDRYGLGQYLQPGMVDRWALYTIAQYCDGEVDDGYGGTEPRFTCSMYLQTASEALNVLRDLASAFRSIMYWRYAYLVVDQDTPDTPVAQFTPANVVDGMFEYTGTAKHTRYTVALVTWLNPDNYYEAEVEYVEDPVGISLYGIKELSMTAVGCTSRGQANRMGKYALLTSRLETDAISFSSGLEGMNVAPGNIVKIVDPLKNQSDEHVGGRVMGITTTSATLDREVTLDFAETYTITLVGTDGVPVSRAVTNGAGTITPPTAITWSSALSLAPDLNTVWTLTKDSESEVLYKITSVKEPDKGSDSFYQLTGVRHDEDKYPLADTPDPLQGPTLPSVPAPGSQPVQNLTLDLGVVARPEGLVRFIDASWTPPVLDANNQFFTGYYLIQIEWPDGSTETYQTYDANYRLYNVDLGTYVFTVWAVSQFDQVKSPPAFASVTVEELTDLDLVEVTGLELVGQGNDPTFEGKDAEFEWRMTSTIEGEIGDEDFPGDSGTPPPWFKDFEVTMLSQEGEVLRVEYVLLPSYIYSYEKNLADGGPRRYFTIEVRVRDIYNRETDEASLFVYNPAPIGFNSIDIYAGLESITISITPPDDNDFVGTKCYVSQTSGFQPSPENLAYYGSDWTFQVLGLTQQIYFVRLEPIDAFGDSGNYTAEQQVNLTTASDILDQIAGQITEGQLYQDLNSRIDLIDIDANNLWDRMAQAEQDIANVDIGATISTYYQATDPARGVPTPSDPPPVLVVGDLWIDSSSGDALKRWNGLDWDTLDTSGSQIYYLEGHPDTYVPSPDPASLSVGDYWIDTSDYDTDGNPDNIPYVWDGLQWVLVRDSALIKVVSDVTVIEAELDDPDSGNTAMAQAVSAMNVEVFGAAGSSNIGANATAISNINAELADPLTGSSGMAGVLVQHDTEVFGTPTGNIKTNADSITVLESEVNSPLTGTSGMATAIQSFNTEVFGTPTDPNSNIKANADAIDVLEATILDLGEDTVPALALAVNSLEVEVWGTSDPESLPPGTDSFVTANATAITALQAEVNSPLTGTSGMATFIQDANVEVFGNMSGQGNVYANAQEISGVKAEIDNPLTGGSAMAQLVQDFNVEVFQTPTDPNSNIKANADAITGIQSEITSPLTGSSGMATYIQSFNTELFDTPTGNVAANATAISNLQVAVSNLGGGESIFSDTEPTTRAPEGTGDPLEDGDLWIETDNDDKPYEWLTDQWVALGTQPSVTTAAVAIESHARITQDLLAFAEYTVKVDVNGHIAGIGLAVESDASGDVRSEIIMLADRFAVGFPASEFQTSHDYQLSEWVTPTQAFVDANGTPDADGIPRWDYVYQVVDDNGSSGATEEAWPSTLGVPVWQGDVQFMTFNKGAQFPFIVGTYDANPGGTPDWQTGIIMNTAMIGQATIDGANIKSATITNANIADLEAGKITAGTIDVTGNLYLGGPNFLLNSEFRKLEIWDDQATPVRRVRMGSLVDGAAPDEWGLELRKADGSVILTTDTGINLDLMGLGDFAFESEINSDNIGALISSAVIGDAYISELYASKITGDIQKFEAFDQTQSATLGLQTSNWSSWTNIFRFRIFAQPFDRWLDVPKDVNAHFEFRASSSGSYARIFYWGAEFKLQYSIGPSWEVYYDVGQPWIWSEQGESGSAGGGETKEIIRDVTLNDMFNKAGYDHPTIYWPANRDGTIIARIRGYCDYTNNPNNKHAVGYGTDSLSHGQMLVRSNSAFDGWGFATVYNGTFSRPQV